MRALIITALATFGADQASKYAVIEVLGLKWRGEIEVLPPYLNFRMAWNEGVNFGLLSSSAEAMRWVLVALALVVSLSIVVWAWRAGLGRMAQISAGLLVGGALGNVLDRLVYGAVADFLNMSCCGIENPFAFNIADVGVFAGALGLVLFAGRSKTA